MPSQAQDTDAKIGRALQFRAERMARNGGYSVMSTPEVRDIALAECKGDYQRDVIQGDESWSGSTLQGKAGKYSSAYGRSRLALKKRLVAAGLCVCTRFVERRKVLIIATPKQAKADPFWEVLS